MKEFFLLFFSLNLKKNDIFKVKTLNNLKSSCINSRSINENIIMKDCSINFISSSSNGGVIYIASSYSLIINDTTFYECFTNSGYGGVICFESGLNILLFKICASNCRAYGNSHQFAYIRSNNYQLLDHVTINKCYNSSIGSTTLTLKSGNQNIFNTNNSYNNNIRLSGIYYNIPQIMSSNFCTFYNNTVKDYWCILLDDRSCTLSKYNIIHNNSPSYGVISTWDSGNYILTEFIFDQNQNILFYSLSGTTLTLNNCYYLGGSFAKYGSVTNILINTISNYYQHSNYLTYFCFSHNLFNTLNNFLGFKNFFFFLNYFYF